MEKIFRLLELNCGVADGLLVDSGMNTLEVAESENDVVSEISILTIDVSNVSLTDVADDI